MDSFYDNAPCVVIGCGNPNRQDDGVGSYVIDILRHQQLGSKVKLLDAGTNGMTVMYQARGAKTLIIIDAKTPESTPGAIYEVPGEELKNPTEYSYSSHSFRWDHALYVGQKIFPTDFPDAVNVFLIEAQALGYHIGLTPKVQEATQKVADRILDILTTNVLNESSPHLLTPDDRNEIIAIDSGKIYLSAQLVSKYFSGISTVAVVIKDRHLHIFPVHGLGGYLLKIHNSVGNCVIGATDVLSAHGLEHYKGELVVKWSEDCQGLVANLVSVFKPVI